MPTLVLELNDAETAKLEALAAFRKCSTVECLRYFIATCQPGGVGGGAWKQWTPPAEDKWKAGV